MMLNPKLDANPINTAVVPLHVGFLRATQPPKPKSTNMDVIVLKVVRYAHNRPNFRPGYSAPSKKAPKGV